MYERHGEVAATVEDLKREVTNIRAEVRGLREDVNELRRLGARGNSAETVKRDAWAVIRGPM